MLEKQIHTLPENYEIHFDVDVAGKTLNIEEYDCINRTKTLLVQWQAGHWLYHNPMFFTKFSRMCRGNSEIYPIIKKCMTYMRNPYKHDELLHAQWITNAYKIIAKNVNSFI